MPKAPVNEDNFPPGHKNEIGRARKIAAMQSIAVAHTEDHAPDQHFWLGVAGADLRHKG